MSDLNFLSSVSAVSPSIRSCRACGLGRDDPAPVPPRYHPIDLDVTSPVLSVTVNTDDRLLILGEAPGRDEAVKGMPFVGPSGRLAGSWIDRLVSARRVASVTRARQIARNEEEARARGVPADNLGRLVLEASRPPLIVVSNVVSCFPGRNATTGRTPTHEEVAACHKNVDAIAAAVRPNKVLLFGGVAVSSWMGVRIGDVAGRWLRLPLNGTYVDAFATWHPAAAIRNVDLQETVREHMDWMGMTWWRVHPSRKCVFCLHEDNGENWWKVTGHGVPGSFGGMTYSGDDVNGSVCMCDEHHRLQMGKKAATAAAITKKPTTRRRKKADAVNAKDVNVQEGLF